MVDSLSYDFFFFFSVLSQNIFDEFGNIVAAGSAVGCCCVWHVRQDWLLLVSSYQLIRLVIYNPVIILPLWNGEQL